MSATLTSGAILQGGRYRIERVLGQGGFGITYLAMHTGFGQKVALKEFFMKELCVRNEETSYVTIGTGESSATVERFRGKFLKEARNLFRLNHKNIVRVLDIFEENGTAYFAMEYAEGGSLSEKVKMQGALPEAVATRYILQVAEALAYLHEQKMNHLDVKPANIMLSAKDNAVLIDFGLAKQYDATGSQTSTTPAGISEGYAPMEQYKLGGVAEFTPETDIYALGATFFKLLTGVTPPSAQDVFEDGVPVETLRQHGVSEVAISVIEEAMKPSKKARMKSAQEFINTLRGTSCLEGTHSVEDVRSSDDEATRVVEAAKDKNEPLEAIVLDPQELPRFGKFRKILTIGLGVALMLYLVLQLYLALRYANSFQGGIYFDYRPCDELVEFIICLMIPVFFYFVNALVLFCQITRKKALFGVPLSTKRLITSIAVLSIFLILGVCSGYRYRYFVLIGMDFIDYFEAWRIFGTYRWYDVSLLLLFAALCYHLLADSWIIYNAIGGRKKSWFPRFKAISRVCMVITLLILLASYWHCYYNVKL